MTTASTLLQGNLTRVFNERDATRRRQAIQELYAPNATLYESEGTFSGTEAIVGAVNNLLASLPPSLAFSMIGPVLQNHDMGKLLWRGHLPDGTTVVTGTDVVQIEAGRIQTIHVFIDPSK